TAGDGGGKAVTSSAADASRAGDDIDFVSEIGLSAEVALEVSPRSLIVIRGLGDHVCHQVSFLIDGNAVLIVAVSVGRHVPAIETAAGVIKTLNPIPGRIDFGIGTEGIDPGQRAVPIRVQVPTDPIRSPLTVV